MGGRQLDMGAERGRQDAFAAKFSVRKGDAETRKVLRDEVKERPATRRGATASVLCLPKCHRPVHTTGHCCNANAGSLTSFFEQ